MTKFKSVISIPEVESSEKKPSVSNACLPWTERESVIQSYWEGQLQAYV